MRKRKMTAHIYFRASKSDVALLDKAAKSLGISRSAFIRRSIEPLARRIIALQK